jgi:ABC-type Mn2+/Zn2+ transport system permease subunit
MIVASNIITLLLGAILIAIRPILITMNIIPFLVLLLLLLLYNPWAVLIFWEANQKPPPYIKPEGLWSL